METTSKDLLLRVRSSRSIIAAAFRLYTRKFWQMLKSQWPLLALTVVAYAAVAMLVTYEFYFFIPLAIAAVVLELLLWWKTGSWLAQRPMRRVLRPAFRYWFRLLVNTLAGILLLLPLCAVVMLPACVLTLAQWDSANGMLMGDANTMPSYVVYMAAVVWIVVALVQVCLRLYLVCLAYYTWGAAEARRIERDQQLQTLSSSEAYGKGS